ncbi:hypothetical protein EV356DRAFT_196950 [Viridothelium virens]|uniref:Uncharacterized protein n=1 Tax=Viridothelium virens TaxID=1048519 RepID=A0A6A6H6T2_VIRVR|nr:hypothetical protein EV356DRAFT_196950 [Viridothelium virens]
MPDNGLRVTEDLISQTGSCSESSGGSGMIKRAVSGTGVFQTFQSLLINTQRGGVLEDLIWFRPGPLQFRNQDIVRALNNAIAFARTNAATLQLSPGTAEAVSRGLFDIALAWCIGPRARSNELVIPASELGGLSSTGMTTSITSCSTTSTASCAVSCDVYGSWRYYQTECPDISSCGVTESLTTTAVSAENMGRPTPVNATTTKSTSSTSSASPFCIPFQDPDSGNPGYCQCIDGQNYVFQSGNNPCPYTTRPPKSDLVTTTTTSPSPTLPLSTSSSSSSSSSVSSVPSPTASILVIRDVPPVTGQSYYDFFIVPPNYSESLDDQCGGRALPSDAQSMWYVDDPKLGRVDGDRPNPVVRTAPGFLQQSGSHCHYEEDTIGTATVYCDNKANLACFPPSQDLANTVVPNNGACGGINDVRQLVMVCPFGDGI